MPPIIFRCLWSGYTLVRENAAEAGFDCILIPLGNPDDVSRILNQVVDALGAKRKMKTVVQLHGCGYGDDGPVLTARSRVDHLHDLHIENGNTFVWKPIAMTADGEIQFAWDGPILVTNKGAEMLFKPQHAMVEIE
jgi:hypothetical protein